MSVTTAYEIGLLAFWLGLIVLAVSLCVVSANADALTERGRQEEDDRCS